MWRRLGELDRILRGETTRPSALQAGQIDVSIAGLSGVLVALGMLYGFFMSWYGLINREEFEYRQMLATTGKVPLLFFLTLLVTFPSLYVFNALVGSRLTPVSLLRLLVAALGVTLAVLASFGPIVAFFSLTTSSYHFMVLLNVLLFTTAGILGLMFLLQTLHRLTLVHQEPTVLVPVDSPEEAGKPASPLDRVQGHLLGRNVKAVFYCWIIVFGLVGAQMSWVLRPFLGDPSQPFQWFRPRQSHFFEAVLQTVRQLFS